MKSAITAPEHSLETRLTRPLFIRLGRMSWSLILLISLFLVSQNIREFYTFAQEICTSDCHPFALTDTIFAQMQAYDLSLTFWATHIILLDIVTVIVFFTASALIFWWRSDDWLALLTSTMLIMLTVNATISNSYSPSTSLLYTRLVQGHTILALYLIMQFIFVFPNGRYVSTSSPYIVWGAVAFQIGFRAFFSTFIDSSFTLLVYFATTLAFIILGVLDQFYRFRKFSTPTQRQQTKWVVLAAALASGGMLVSATLYFTLLPLLDAYFNTLPLNLFFRGTYYLSFMAVPFGLSFSVFRYKIWEADLAIHRSLVFGGISLILFGLFGISFLALDQLFHMLLGRDARVMASVVSTGGAVISFRPISAHVQQWIDRHIYQFRADFGELAQMERRRQAVLRMENPGDLSAQIIDKWEIGGVIGKGGMGQVYYARDLETHEAVAVKILARTLVNDPDSVSRFRREAMLASQVRHPQIVHVIDHGIQDNLFYLVMPYIDGNNLATQLQSSGPFQPETLLPILRDMVDALGYLHTQALVHRDIKPGNIILSPQNRAYVTDFGLAKALADSTQITSTGIVGTLDYIAPEQLRETGTVDQRSDLYGLGATCYHLLTGKPPFSGGIGNLVFAHLYQPAPDARVLVPTLPAETSAILQRAMAKDPDDRYQTVHEFFAAFEASLIPTPIIV